MSEAKHTPMAYRAANAITHIHRFQMTLADRDEIAGIIDEETAAPELLEALEQCCDAIGPCFFNITPEAEGSLNPDKRNQLAAYRVARAAIRKARKAF